MRVAIVGGGINGIMSAWALARAGHQVELFERGTLVGETSANSTKLLHGGLRYLEQGHLLLVRESLRERAWWLAQAPHLARPIRLIFPYYSTSPRPAWQIKTGLVLYDWLAGATSLGAHAHHGARELIAMVPELNAHGLRGGYSFVEAQMHDQALGRWAAQEARQLGVRVREQAPVERIGSDGALRADARDERFDAIVNLAGPWAKQLLVLSGIDSRWDLDLVRGSHLLLKRRLAHGFVLQHPHDARVCFILPYQGQTLVGTTEVRQSLADPIGCSAEEQAYLLALYRHYFTTPVSEADIGASFAGVRPLIRSHANPSKASREYVIEINQRLINVFGGKWTTARALGAKVARQVAALAA